MSNINPLLLTDAYKTGHVEQYPEGTKQIWCNLTPRKSRVAGITRVVNFGWYSFIQDILQQKFRGFFADPKPYISDYRDFLRGFLGVSNPKVDHFERLADTGFLPLKIYALPEGVSVPFGVPVLVLTNTQDHAYWLPNWLETLLSNQTWRPLTAATLARRLRLLLEEYAEKTGADPGFVDWQGHDFSMRGMGGLEDSILSGMGHLTSFKGTDSLPSVRRISQLYGDLTETIGGSVAATEHSVMSAGGKESELETFRRLLTEVYPTGICSIVSDTWDFWKVLAETVPALQSQILGRNGKLVIRPDSGNPKKILLGDIEKTPRTPEYWGALDCLGQNGWPFAHNAKGFDQLVNVGFIYGDGITYDVAKDILSGMVDQGWASDNLVFGVGSYTYAYNTRDTFGLAVKATAVRDSSGVRAIFKDPVTDSGLKKSAKGILAVYEREDREVHSYYLLEEATEAQLDNCAFDLVYSEGELQIPPTFAAIRQRVKEGKI